MLDASYMPRTTFAKFVKKAVSDERGADRGSI
jgi:hypothetical protein